jgi:hypothetical protein
MSKETLSMDVSPQVWNTSVAAHLQFHKKEEGGCDHSDKVKVYQPVTRKNFLDLKHHARQIKDESHLNSDLDTRKVT